MQSSYEASLIEHYRGVLARTRPAVQPRVVRPAPLIAPPPARIPSPAPKRHPRDFLIVSEPATRVDPPWHRLVQEVANSHGFELRVLTSMKRDRKACIARAEAFYRLYHEHDLSMAQIGRLMGDRDFTTVRYGIQKHEERMRQQA